jgi:hypothetical protein
VAETDFLSLGARQKFMRDKEGYLSKQSQTVTSSRRTNTSTTNKTPTIKQLIADLQRVREENPNATISRGFYRGHANFKESAWEKHWGSFQAFRNEAEVLEHPASATTINTGGKDADKPVEDNLAQNLKELLSGKKVQRTSIVELADRFDRSPATIQKTLGELNAAGYNFHILPSNEVDATGFEPEAETRSIIHSKSDYEGGWIKIGAMGDKHYCSKYCREDVIEAMYDRYEEEGIKTVFDTGNWIDGEARFNFSDLKIYGMEPQIRYWAEHHPRRPGITTYFVAGDDHEGWYQQRNKMSIGRYAERIARDDFGRDDLVYLGYMEADVRLPSRDGKGESWLKVMHPGGGSAYAESYSQQKIAEAFSEGEKPHICLVGHYHKMIYGYHRGIHMLQTGTGEDQTPFMRKKRLKAAVGGCILDIHQAPTGEINRLKPEFFTFYDRDFYENRRQFDTTDMPSIDFRNLHA